MIYLEKPEDFENTLEVSGCFIEYDGKFLQLLRPSHKSHPLKWGLPGGKHEIGETALDAVKREVFEETGIEISDPSYKYKLYVENTGNNFVYNTFHFALDKLPNVKINEGEHEDYRWFLPEESLSFPMVHDQDALVKIFYNIKS